MDTVDFRIAWEVTGDELCRFSADSLSRSNISKSAKHFLEVAGLPKDAAPFLAFGPTSLDWLPRNGQAEFGRYYGIGSDGEGNPFVLDAAGAVWLLDHETSGHTTFVNSSVQALGECLLAYRSFVMTTIAARGDDAFLEGLTSKLDVETLSQSVKAIDSGTERLDSFWRSEIARLAAESTN